MQGETQQEKPRRRGGGVMVVGLGLAIFLGMVLIAIPGVDRMHRDNARRICIENLVMLDIAKEKYALDQQLKPGAPVSLDQLSGPAANRPGAADQPTTRPICIAGGTYAINPIGQIPTCTVPGHEMPVPEKFSAQE